MVAKQEWSKMDPNYINIRALTKCIYKFDKVNSAAQSTPSRNQQPGCGNFSSKGMYRLKIYVEGLESLEYLFIKKNKDNIIKNVTCWW